MNHTLIKLFIKLNPENKSKIEGMFRNILKDKFMRLDLFSYGLRRTKMDKLITKMNRRLRGELVEATINILKELGCTNFKPHVSTKLQAYLWAPASLITCDTPHGERTVKCLHFSFTSAVNRVFEDSTIGVDLVGSKYPSVLDFKGESGGIESIISDDYAKYYYLIQRELYAISEEFKILELGFVETC